MAKQGILGRVNIKSFCMEKFGGAWFFVSKNPSKLKKFAIEVGEKSPSQPSSPLLATPLLKLVSDVNKGIDVTVEKFFWPLNDNFSNSNSNITQNKLTN